MILQLFLQVLGAVIAGMVLQYLNNRKAVL